MNGKAWWRAESRPEGGLFRIARNREVSPEAPMDQWHLLSGIASDQAGCGPGLVADFGLIRGLPFDAMAPFGPLYLRQRATPG
jgi:hypothetical protein